MRILVVSATLAELQPMINNLKITVDQQKNTYHTNFASHEITMLITGIGMVATAYHMGEINKTDFDMALNVGIAGSFTRDLAIGELVNVTTDGFAELGADYGDKFIPLNHLDFAKDSTEPFIDINGQINNPTPTDNPILSDLRKAKGITVNTVNGETKRIEKIKELFAPDIESMEGASFLYGCLKKSLPCFQLRTISNYIEPRNLNNWNIPFAIANLNKQLLEIIKAF
ncbi:MAG TPA: futalosine hydrolase [Bacteroidales bacterium]|nr:futalosine hydrolase [Bacteroidales bacterium]